MVRHAEGVRYVLQLVNRDRAKSGLAPVSIGHNTAAQAHAEEMLSTGYVSHWGLDGLKPYMRYTLAGGFGHEGENVSGPSQPLVPGLSYAAKELGSGIEEIQRGFMASPGHRKNILDRWHKKLNVGLAFNAVAQAVVQQFEGDYVRFWKPPQIRNGVLFLDGATATGVAIDGVQVWYDPLPHPLTPEQLRATGPYWSGRPAVFVRPPAPFGRYYTDSATDYTWETFDNPYVTGPELKLSAQCAAAARPATSQERVKYVDAEKWRISGPSFDIEAQVSEAVKRLGPGVYTVHLWARISGEPVRVSNYSIFVR